jgi:hypothetical protein
MPGIWHDSANELFKDDPEFARRLFRLAGVELPLDVEFIQAPTNETDRTLSNDLDRPGRVPAFASAAQAMADPAMGIMSVAYHGAADEAVINAFAAGILTLSPDRAKKYYEYGLRMSPEFVRNALEHLMATKYNEPFSKLGLTYYGQGREEGREEGLVAGERGTVLMVLKARGLPVSDSQRSRIDACDDLAVLKAWAETALTAATVDDLFK